PLAPHLFEPQERVGGIDGSRLKRVGHEGLCVCTCNVDRTAAAGRRENHRRHVTKLTHVFSTSVASTARGALAGKSPCQIARPRSPLGEATRRFERSGALLPLVGRRQEVGGGATFVVIARTYRPTAPLTLPSPHKGERGEHKQASDGVAPAL